jgi:hypothetical protein
VALILYDRSPKLRLNNLASPLLTSHNHVPIQKVVGGS